MRPNNLTKARAVLIVDHPFFASLLLPMSMEADESIQSIATDGASIKYNPEYIDSLDFNETIFVLAHEMLHCVFDHPGRRGSRGKNRWNQATDYVVNEILVKDRIGSMPHGGLHNPSLVQKGGGTAEGIYKILPEEDEKKDPGDPGGSLDQLNDAGTNNGTEPTDAAKMAQASADLKVRVIAAKNAAKMQGKLSAGMERLVENLLKPQVDWRHELRKFMSKRAKVDWSFARPKRRFLSEELYLPSQTGERMGGVVIANDCSGSVSPVLLKKMCAEINAIREDLKPEWMKVVHFDSVVTAVDSVRDDEDLIIKPKGGGGTAFSPVIRYVNEMEEQPACVVFLTDLECYDFGKAPEYPVLWCVMGGKAREVPYGHTLEVSDDS